MPALLGHPCWGQAPCRQYRSHTRQTVHTLGNTATAQTYTSRLRGLEIHKVWGGGNWCFVRAFVNCEHLQRVSDVHAERFCIFCIKTLANRSSLWSLEVQTVSQNRRVKTALCVCMFRLRIGFSGFRDPSTSQCRRTAYLSHRLARAP